MKSIKGMKAKAEELLQNKGTKETWQINAAWDSESNAFVIKDIIGIIGKSWWSSNKMIVTHHC